MNLIDWTNITAIPKQIEGLVRYFLKNSSAEIILFNEMDYINGVVSWWSIFNHLTASYLSTAHF